MLTNRESAPSDQVIKGAQVVVVSNTSTCTSPSPDNATIQRPLTDGGGQFGQDPLDHNNIYGGFIANDSIIYPSFEQIFTAPDGDDPRLYKDGCGYQDSAMNTVSPRNTKDPSTESGLGQNWEVNTSNFDPQYGLVDAYTDRPEDQYDNQISSHSFLKDGKQPSRQQGHRRQWQMNPNEEYGSIDKQSDSNDSVTFSQKSQRPALSALTSSQEHWVTSTTSSASLHALSTPDTANVSSPLILKLRRGRPRLYPPLSTYESRPQIVIPEQSYPSEASLPSPLITFPTRPSPVPRPRRGRPPLYARPPSTPTSTQKATREHNRLAAQRFRARQDAYMATLNTQAEDLELKNRDLKDEVARLREERLNLRGGMLEHGKCGCDVMETYLQAETNRLRGDREDIDNSKERSGEEGRNAVEDKIDEL